MYRVELKVSVCVSIQKLLRTFLMYRVELKGGQSQREDIFLSFWFLMYRVELKVPVIISLPPKAVGVPNVPCGVESSSRSLSALSYSSS